MPDEKEANQIRLHAQDLMSNGTIDSFSVVPSARIEMPVPVLGPECNFHSWFVPLTSGDYLIGFFQFLPDGTLMRFSSFQRHASDLAHCPAAADWLDPERIRARAGSQHKPGETINEPYLTFDRTPDRLIWAIPMKDASGMIRFVYVAGEKVYLKSSGDTIG